MSSLYNFDIRSSCFQYRMRGIFVTLTAKLKFFYPLMLGIMLGIELFFAFH